jgi:IclR family transcriptional regulator, KDG regulon repressor
MRSACSVGTLLKGDRPGPTVRPCRLTASLTPAGQLYRLIWLQTSVMAKWMTTLEAVPAHCSASGKAALAFQEASAIERVISPGPPRFTSTTITERSALLKELAKIRETGYAVDDEEHEPGVRCIGAPIRDTGGRAFAGLSLTGAARRIAPPRFGELAAHVKHHARSISAQLAYRA